MRPVMAALSFNWIVSAKAKERPDQATNMTNANRFDMGRSYLRRAMVTSRLWAGAWFDLPAPHTMPLFLSDLPIFRGIDIQQFVRLAAWETHGLGAERAGQLVQRV